jgi:hypothetical protein
MIAVTDEHKRTKGPSRLGFNIRKPGIKDYGPMSVAVGNGYWPIATAVAAIQLGTSRRALDDAGDLVKVKPGRDAH